MVNKCNSSVSVLVEFIAVLFGALQKFRVRAAKVFELTDEIYSHMCFICASCVRRNLTLIQSITPGTAHWGLVSGPFMQQLFDSFFELLVVHDKLFGIWKVWFIVLIVGT